ncbi:MAG: hypothetical protein GY862_23435 [Gammaproteobacteria bacterium]|nr:hypothetical protein [Gammaproteobacteria bacterium]
MLPWSQYNYHFPLSGDVAQQIDWFSGHINPDSGDAEIEKEIFQKTASYGTQLGIITEVLLSINPDALTDSQPLKQLKELQEKVENIKAEKKERTRKNAKRILDKLAQSDPKGLEEVLKKYK